MYKPKMSELEKQEMEELIAKFKARGGTVEQLPPLTRNPLSPSALKQRSHEELQKVRSSV
jgi:hypothetical protein